MTRCRIYYHPEYKYMQLVDRIQNSVLSGRARKNMFLPSSVGKNRKDVIAILTRYDKVITLSSIYT